MRSAIRVVYLDTEVTNGALDLGVAEQKLNRKQIFCPMIDRRRLDHRRQWVPNFNGSRPMLATTRPLSVHTEAS
jgi:hypothetical protein